MSLFAINGVELGGSIVNGSIALHNREIGGGVSYAYSGTARRSRIALKRDITFDTIPLSIDDALAWEGLILGKGHHFSYAYGTTGANSSKGCVPEGWTTGLWTVPNSPGAIGVAGFLRILTPSGRMQYYPGFGTDGSAAGPASTIMFWKYGAGQWHHYVVSGTRKWYDGVRADGTTTTWLDFGMYVGRFYVTFLNSTGADENYDELDILPYAIPEAWPPLIFASNGVPPFGYAPELFVTGSLITDPATRSMLGASVTSIETKCVISGTLQAARILSVTLEEL